MIDTQAHIERVKHLLSFVRYQSGMWHRVCRILELLQDGRVQEADLALRSLTDGYLGGLADAGCRMTELGRRLKEAADHLSGALFIV